MIDPHQVLEGLRRDLRGIVLPAVEDEYARSVVVAMMGILRELGPRLRADERWCMQSVQELRAGCERWADALDDLGANSVALRDASARAARETSPEAARGHLLAAASDAVRSVWAAPPGDHDLLLDIRRVLAADLARQLSPTNTAHPDPPDERAQNGRR